MSVSMIIMIVKGYYDIFCRAPVINTSMHIKLSCAVLSSPGTSHLCPCYQAVLFGASDRAANCRFDVSLEKQSFEMALELNFFTCSQVFSWIAGKFLSTENKKSTDFWKKLKSIVLCCQSEICVVLFFIYRIDEYLYPVSCE